MAYRRDNMPLQRIDMPIRYKRLLRCAVMYERFPDTIENRWLHPILP